MAAASRVVVTAAGALTTIVLARLLGPGDWGTYFVGQSLIVMLTAATTLGVEHGIAYFVSSGEWAPRRAHQSALRVATTMGLSGAVVGIGVRLAFPSALAGLTVPLTLVVVAGLPFALAWFYESYIAVATDHYERSMLMAPMQALLALGLAIPGVLLFGLAGAICAMTIATVLVGLAAVFWARRQYDDATPAPVGQLRRAISFGIKGFAANALQMVNYRLDLFVLAAVASTATVGQYSLAVALTSLLWLLPRALSDVLFPRVARLSTGGDEAGREFVETKGVRHASMVVFATAIMLAVGLWLLVVPVFGDGFRPSIALGFILLPGAAAIGLTSVLGATVVGRGKPIYSLYGTLITTPLTVALYATLIPAFHANGAALASTVSYLAGFAVICWFYRRVTGRRVLPLLAPTRSELDDLRALPRSFAARAGALRR